MQENDRMYQKLRSMGYEGALNDMLYDYLRSQGYTGSLSDMIAAKGGWKQLVPKFSPSDLIQGYEGLYADFSTLEGVDEVNDTSLVLSGYTWNKRGTPVLTPEGISFNRDQNQLLIAGSDLASLVDDYPLTMAMQLVSSDAGSIDYAVISGSARYYTLRATSRGTMYIVTRNDSYISSELEAGNKDVTLVGDFRSDRSGLYTQDQGPAYHNSQPTIVGRATEVSLGGMSDSTPDYGTGVVKSIFIVNRSLTDEEREQLIQYMRS